jgi:hypothetical protein
MSETYESLRDGAPGKAGELWRQADNLQQQLRNRYEALEADERYTDEYKSSEAWTAYGKARREIARLRSEARRELLDGAAARERGSIPFPKPNSSTPQGSQGLYTNDVTELVATQNEAARLMRRLEREKERAEPFRASPAALLAAEFDKAHELGAGIQSTTRIRAIVDVADELGIDLDGVVESHRRPLHREWLEEAEDFRYRASMIPTTEASVPKPPFDPPPAEKLAKAGISPLEANGRS